VTLEEKRGERRREKRREKRGGGRGGTEKTIRIFEGD